MKESLKKIAAETEKALFLNFINEEISAIESKKKDGYTPWMLVAAETVLFSYLLSALESGQPVWRNTGTLFLFIIFLYDAVESFLYFITPSARKMPQQNNRFYIPLYQEFSTRTMFLFTFIKCSILLLVFRFLAFNGIFSSCAIFFLYLMALISILSFLLSFSKKSRKKKDSSTSFVVILLLTPFYIALWGLFLEVAYIYSDLTLIDIKIAFSCATMLIILNFLVRAFSNPPNFDEELKNIKRSLALNLITTLDAKQQTDKIFFGYTAEDFDSQQIKDMQNNINALKELVLTLENNIENIKEVSSYNIDFVQKIMDDIASIINSTIKNTPGKFKMLFEGDVECKTYTQQMKEMISLYEKAVSLIKEVEHIQENTIAKLQNEREKLRNEAEEKNKNANLLEEKEHKLREEIEGLKQKIKNQQKATL